MKSILTVAAITLATITGFTACHHNCKGKEKCEKMEKEGKCCKKDTASCCMKGTDNMKKECCKKDSTKN